jgi:N,N'-diacetyllegionaminate synthase
LEIGENFTGGKEMIKSVEDVIKDEIFIIAEAGVNHNGDIEIAKKMIDAAVRAGADAVKFQTFNTDKLVTKNAPKADYQNEKTDRNESQYDMLKKLELSKKEHKILKNYCEEKKILFMSTPFDFESADLLEKLGVNLYKIGSGDLTNIPLLEYIAKKQKPMIVSTGMANLAEVEEAVDAIRDSGNEDVILLHCLSNYPAKFENVNLSAMNTMKIAFNLEIGYSDHTPGIEVSIAAVAMGAKVIEKHFTLDKTLQGNDHYHAMDPDDLRKFRNNVDMIKTINGSYYKRPLECESESRKQARRSIVALKDMKAGDTITRDKITFKRPGTGISPADLDKVLGRKLKEDVKEDELLVWANI